MGEKYYIPTLPAIQDNLDSTSKALIVPDDANLVEFNSEIDYQHFLTGINDIQYVNDRQLYDAMIAALPDIGNYIKDIPISIGDLRAAFGHIFDDLPDQAFEGKTLIQCLKTMFNHFIKKNENIFLAVNIKNGNLKYDELYKYRKTQDIYFDMMKLEFNLEIYYDFFCDAQSVLRRIFLKQILFSNEPISDKKRELINRAFNLNGQALADFQEALEKFKSTIRNHRRTLKRANLPLLERYNEIENKTLDKITAVLEDVDKRIIDTDNSKKRLGEEVKKRHNLISLETAKKLLKEIPYLRALVKND